MLSEIQLEELLSDSEASRTCQRLIDCYVRDGNLKGVEFQESIKPSGSLISATIKNGTEGIKNELENINQAVSAVDSVLNKALVNYTSEIIQSFEEVNEFATNLREVSSDLEHLNEGVGKRYRDILSLYNSVECDTVHLERLRNVYLYSLECRRILRFLGTLYERVKGLKDSVSDFLEMLLISSQCMSCLDRILGLESSDALLKYCEVLKNCIVKKVYDYCLTPLFKTTDVNKGVEFGRRDEKMVVISHAIYKHLSVSSKVMLGLIENLVSETTSLISLDDVMNDANWQSVLISQVSQFLLKYVRNQRAIYFICKCSKYSLAEKLERSERDFISKFLQTYVHEDQKEPFSLCELYTKRCIGFLTSTLSSLYQNCEKYDVVMIVPELISLGDSMHCELNSLNLPFNPHKYYFKAVCEDYAKTFVSIAAKKIIPVSKIAFANCIKALPTLEASTVPGANSELNQATHMLMNLPVENEVWSVVGEFMRKSSVCPAIFKQVCSIVSSALETVFGNVAKIRSSQGTRLNLSDGSSKIVLTKPSDSQALNARLHHFVSTIIDGIESDLIHLVPQDSSLLSVLDYGKSIPLISSWSQDLCCTIWHTFSYISLDNPEFTWTCKQVNIATKNVVKILSFLKDSYFDPLIPVGRQKLLSTFASNTAASFLIYALTTWPLNEEEKLLMLNSTTELEFVLSDILREKLGKNEADYFSFFRRLIFLTDEELFNTFSNSTFSLPKDVILLHITCRLLRDNGLDKNLCKYMGFTTPHFMLEGFKQSMLEFQDSNYQKLHHFVFSLGLSSTFYINFVEYLNGF